MIGLFKTIIFLVGTYYVIRFIMRFIVPVFRKVPAKNTGSSTHSSTSSARNRSISDQAGEYVDYEEIK